MTSETVHIELLPESNILIMTWEHRATPEDVRAAFAEMLTYLNAAVAPMDVIVDLRQNPVFPIVETIGGALYGPFRHAMLGDWVVVGASVVARSIGRTLESLSRRHNIRWFDRYEEAVAFAARKNQPV